MGHMKRVKRGTADPQLVNPIPLPNQHVGVQDDGYARQSKLNEKPLNIGTPSSTLNEGRATPAGAA